MMGWPRERLERLLHISGPVPFETEHFGPFSNGSLYKEAFGQAEKALSAYFEAEPFPEETPEKLWAELASLSQHERIERVSAARFGHPQMVRFLVDRSQSIRYQDPEEMLHLAELARLAAEACSPVAAGNEIRLADLRTRAWGQAGNALRLRGHLLEAEQAFATAQQYRGNGTGDPFLRAWLFEKITSLHIFQGQFNKAVELSEEAGQIYQEIGESHLLASTMVQKAIASLYAGETESAIHLLTHAIPLIDQEEDPHLLLAACHNLVRGYIDLDRPAQALQIYSEAQTLYREFDDPLILLRATWQEGQLLRDLGHLRTAESALLRARQGFTDRNLPYEVALVSLDLAAIYVRLGLVEEVKQTVVTTVPIFQALRVGKQILASLLQLQQVADQEQRALELIRSLSARLEPLSKRLTKKKED
jgi:tetratricopeptide (TPR) repeat protein